jgi:DNA-3-methyladenine glycosylase I
VKASQDLGCAWPLNHPLEKTYHDKEWGVPVKDDNILFEFLTLEGAQAGLSWRTILTKRENYRVAFDYFNPHLIANYGASKIEALLLNEGIVRNKLKINSVVSNAKAFIEIQKRHGSFSNFLWGFVDGKPIQNNWKSHSDIPAKTTKSDQLSKILKSLGFKFVGSTIVYAYMQAVGLVNDHTINCPRHQELAKLKS